MAFLLAIVFWSLTIASIMLLKQGLDASKFDLDTLTDTSESYTGAEIEKCVKKGIMLVAWRDEEPTTQSMIEAISRVTPISITMKEEMNKVRQWCATRTQNAGKLMPTRRTATNNKRTIDV